MKRQCSTCDYYRSTPPPPGPRDLGTLLPEPQGECRRHAPSVQVIALPAMGALGQPGVQLQMITATPTIKENYDCGDWSPSLLARQADKADAAKT